jgi:hypothetical protein
MGMNTTRLRVAAEVRRPKDAPVALREVLTLSKRPTRLELVCWALNVDERLAAPAWALALQNGLLEAAGVDAASGKTMFTLSERGRLALPRLGRRRLRFADPPKPRAAARWNATTPPTPR